MLAAQFGERDHRHLYGPVAGAERGRRLSMFHVGGREAVEGLDHMEVGLAALRADQGRDRDVAGPQPRIEIDQLLLRLDGDALPAALVEKERDIVRDRMAGADVDVGTMMPLSESNREVGVLHILRIGEVHAVDPLIPPLTERIRL
jgi:hypothetical protein